MRSPATCPKRCSLASCNGSRWVAGSTTWWAASSKAVANPTWDPIAKPGALRPYFEGNPERLNPLEMLKDREPLPAYYMEPAARVKMIEQQGLQGVWLFPTLGVLYEEVIKHDVDAVVMMMQAFNQWLHDDWTFNYENTIFAAPYIALGDVDAAVAEVDKVLGMGANVLVMRPAPVTTRTGVVSPFNPMFDPVWARINESGVPLVIRGGLRLLVAGLRRRCLLVACGWRWRRPVAQGVRYRTRGAGLVDPGRLREDLRPVPQPALRLDRERLGLPWPDVPEVRSDRQEVVLVV